SGGAIAISRLSDPMSGLAPFKSCRARFTASTTSSKRLELFCKQSSTVIRAIRNDIPSGHSTQETSSSWEPAAKGSQQRGFSPTSRDLPSFGGSEGNSKRLAPCMTVGRQIFKNHISSSAV